MVTTRSKSKSNTAKTVKVSIKPSKIKKQDKKLKLSKLASKEFDDDSDSDFLPSFEETEDDTMECEEEESDNESEDDDEFLFEEDYIFPKSLAKNGHLKTKFDSIVTKIKNNTPTLQQILTLRIRPKRKRDLLEKYYIYKYSMYPHSEEKFYMKKELNQAITFAKREYKEFLVNKKKFLSLERNEMKETDITLLKNKLFNIETNEANLSLLYQSFNSLESRESSSDEFYKKITWIKLALRLPFNRVKEIPYKDNITEFLKEIKQTLDQKLFGMKNVKEKLLLYIHDRLINPNTKSPLLALIGPPGIGKTSIAQVLSECLTLPFQQIALGGVNDASYLPGHDSTYIGSKPGRISNALINAGYKNPIIFFDELDKVESPEILSSLLHITDTSQNHDYRDNYFGSLSIDLSTSWLIASLNEKPRDRALSDRMSFIQVDEYTEQDKSRIVEDYLLPNALLNVSLQRNDVTFESKETLDYLVRKISSGNTGIRKLKESINTLISKLLFLVNNKDGLDTSFSLSKDYNSKLEFPFTVTRNIIDKLLSEFTIQKNPSLSYLYV